MTRDQKGEQSPAQERARRFRVVRRVPRKRIETWSERELRELEEMGDDADRGTPEQDAALRSGCMSMVWVVGFFFVVMIFSILATMMMR